MGRRKFKPIPDIAKGDIVTAAVSGMRKAVSTQRYIRFEAGDELGVMSVNEYGVRVRKDGSPIFWLELEEVNAPRHLGDVPEGAIAPDHPDLDWLWRDAAKAANALGYCAVFDQITALLAIPGRERRVTAEIEVAPGVQLRGSVRARSMKEAEQKLIEKVRAAAPSQLALGASPEALA